MIWTNFSLHYLWMLPSNFDVFCQMMFKNIFHYLLICSKNGPHSDPTLPDGVLHMLQLFWLNGFWEEVFIKLIFISILKLMLHWGPTPESYILYKLAFVLSANVSYTFFFKNLNKIILIISPSMWAWLFILTYIPFTYRDVMPSWITIGWWFRRRS